MFVYLDYAGIMHCVQSMDTAKEYAVKNGKIEETNLASDAGYPVENGVTMFVYADDNEVYENHNAGKGNKISMDTFKKKYPAIYELYTKII